MPEILRLNNIGQKGLATDPAPWSLPADFITYGENFKVATQKLISAGGSQLWSTVGANFNPGNPFHTGANSTRLWIVAGRSKVYAFDGTTWTDISSVTGYGTLSTDDELLWSACLLGQIPIINNPQSTPEYWNPQLITQVMQPLLFEPGITWDTNNYSAKIMRSHKTFLFALNLTEGSTEFPDSYRWSHPADINGLPATWDETDDAFLAGKASLGGDGGEIIDGMSMRDAFVIYSESGIDILDYTNDEFVWRRRELSSSFGLLARDCVVEVKGTHFFITDGDIMMNDGNSISSVIHNRLKREFSNRIDPNNYDRSYAVKYDTLKEIWFCIPEVGESYPTVAYVYNWRDDSWGIGDLPADVALSSQGSRTVSEDDWDDLGDSETWDVQVRRWDSFSNSPLTNTIVGANPVTGTLHFVIPDGTSDDDFTTTIERIDFPLIDEREVTTITRIYPHMSGDLDITVQFGSQDFPGAPVRWKPAVLFNPETDRKIDIRTTGELHAWKFTTIGKTLWEMSGMTIEFERAGVR